MLSLWMATLDSSFVPWTLWACTLGAAVVCWRVWSSRREGSVSDAERLAEKRADNLGKILEIGNTMNATLDLDRLLSRIAQAVRESLGFRMVLVRLLDEEDGAFKARAFAGLDETAVAKLRENAIPLAEFKDLMREEFRISRSYFISHEAQYWDQNDERLVIPDLGERSEGEWHPLDSLFVPLLTRDRRLIGYLSVDDPVDRKIPSRDVIDTLEIFSNQAVTAIENAQLYRELEDKIHELRSVTVKLEDLNEAKNAFMANVSHELRTPLTSIRAYLDTIRAEVGPDLEPQKARFLDVIAQETSRLTGLVDDLLSFSKMEAGSLELNRVSLRLDGLVREAISVVGPEARHKNLTIIKDLVEASPIMADRDLLIQLILNLLRNAVKFTEPGGRITTRVRNQEDGVLLEVEDTGIGIPRENQEKIFDRFYQSDGSMTRKYGGVGLGLAICRTVVGRHGGEIWVESEEGNGARFMVRLPKYGTERREPSTVCGPRSVPDLMVELIAEVMQSKNASIMLVDDEKDNLYIETAVGLNPEIIRNTRVRLGQDISGWVAKHGRPLLICDIEQDERFGRRNRPGYETKSLLSVPLTVDGRVIGVLNVSNRVSCTTFTQDDADLLGCLANRMALVLDRVGRGQDPTTGFESTERALQSIIEAHRTSGNLTSPTMIRALAEVCRKIGMAESDVDMMRYIVGIYDVGMTEVDRSILSKSDRLEPEEIEEIRNHPQLGIEILSPIEFLDEVKDVILHHHEWYDGRGYPDGLSGMSIPRGARVLAVVDAFRSMTTERPYRRARTPAEALEELERCAGIQFDPEVVRAFVGTWREMHAFEDEPEIVPSGAFEV